jgi:hypothetical protein
LLLIRFAVPDGAPLEKVLQSLTRKLAATSPQLPGPEALAAFRLVERAGRAVRCG